MATLFVGRPELICSEQKMVLRAPIACECGKLPDHLWFATGPEYGHYLVEERGDAFLVAVLIHALREKHDIRLLALISERLFYSVTEYLIPALHRALPTLGQISIDCELDSTVWPNARAVGAGNSCGVDSMFTVAKHTSPTCPAGFRLTHLTFHDCGSHRRHLFSVDPGLADDRRELTSQFAREIGLPQVSVDTNLNTLPEAINLPFEQMHTYLNTACALALQKLFKTYYYSSSFPADVFRFTLADSAYYDTFTLPLLATEQLSFSAAGKAYSRAEKMQQLMEYEPSHSFLNVCTTALENCSSCEKCLRTLVAIELLGGLDVYEEVFDLETYAKHRSRHVVDVLKRDGHYYQEIRELMQETGSSLRVPMMEYLLYSLRRKVADVPVVQRLYYALRGWEITP